MTQTVTKMSKHAHQPIRALSSLVMAFCLLTACGGSGADGPTLADIPQYPGSSPAQSMQQDGFGGMGASLSSFTSADPHEEVMSFFRDALREHDATESTFDLESGRQASFDINGEDRKITVVVQDYPEEGQVKITVMELTH